MKREILIKLRRDRNWKQTDVTKLLEETFGIKISTSYYGMIEQGKRRPPLETGVAIADLFGTEVKEIFFDHLPNRTLGRSVAEQVA